MRTWFPLVATLSPWFLTLDELKRSANGVLPANLTVASENNRIQVLQDAKSWMARLFDVVSATRKGDFVHVAAWEMDLDVYLKPAIAGNRSRLDSMFLDAMNRGVDVLFLLSSNALQLQTSTHTCGRLNAVCGQCCISDSRHGNLAFGSAHVKQWSIMQGKRLISFLGSDDIAPGRWDSSEHDLKDPLWDRQPKDFFRMFGWHSMMYEIEGQASWDLEQMFWYRWHDPSPPNALTPSIFRSAKSWLTPYPLVRKEDIAYPDGDLEVQVVRTFGCLGARSGMYQNFSPYGDYSFAALWNKALGRARKYIYVADQFLYFRDALKAVLDALPRVDFIIILTNTGSMRRDLGVFHKGHQHQQWRAIVEPIMTKYPKLREKVFMYSLARDGAPVEYGPDWQIYNHEKTLLIDDEFAFVGSSGEDSSSFTSDIDAHIGIVSRKFTKNLRIRMMAEHLQIKRDDPRLENPQDALHLFVENAATTTGRLRNYWPTQPLTYHYWIFNFGMAIFFVEGRCPDLKDMWPGTWVNERAPQNETTHSEAKDSRRKSFLALQPDPGSAREAKQ